MTAWRLSLRDAPEGRIDASSLRLDALQSASLPEVAKWTVSWLGAPLSLGDLFRIERQADVPPRLVLEGELGGFDGLGTGHAAGDFIIEGSAGNHCAAGMRGGTLRVTGDVGDCLAAPRGAQRSGMRGGRVFVDGSAGNDAAHRLRRGEILIDGNCGDFAASHLVAGTLVVGGHCGRHVGYGMRRGTIVLEKMPPLPTERFSFPVPLRSVVTTLFHRSLRGTGHACPKVADVVRRVAEETGWSRRGDAAVAGQGEIWAAERA